MSDLGKGPPYPWYISGGFQALPHCVPSVLLSMGFYASEVLVILTLFSFYRPESDSVVVTQADLQKYSGASKSTVLRTIRRATGYGLVCVKSEGRGNIYNLEAFRDSVRRASVNV